tara:strand:- start:300 stop:557 length:258 start_codon:yes stop_codon:yes gene_type:complete
MCKSAIEVAEHIKNILQRNDPSINLDDLEPSTDLSEYGIESIMVLTIIAEIEEKFKKKVSLTSLEKNNYIISANTLSQSFNNEKS